MATVLFLSVPSHGHVNPTIGLVSELIKQGEKVIYFSSLLFKDKIEKTGAVFKNYAEDLDIFKPRSPDAAEENATDRPLHRVIQSAPSIIADILAQINGVKIDYMIYSAPFLFAKPLTQILAVPTVSSLAVFMGLDFFQKEADKPSGRFFPGLQALEETYQQVAGAISETYGVNMPPNALGLLFNKGDINLVYTSRYFASDIPYFDDTFKLVGPPVFDRSENVDFPFDKLAGKKVLYISLGTVFGNFSGRLYDVFFNSFADWDGVVVMAAYQVDQSPFDVPANFIVRDYIPQNRVLAYADAAITHAGMNSMNDLLYHGVPFVSLPMGADQPALAKRAAELGATIVLDIHTVGPEGLRSAVETVMADPAYRDNIRQISDSFKAAGGYPKAVEEIFKLKAKNRIQQ